MKPDFLKIILFISFFLTIFVAGNPSLATVSNSTLNPAPLNAGVPTGTDFRQVILKITNYLLYLIGSVAVLFIVFAGFNYITSGGDEKKIEKAKQILLYAIIGLIGIRLKKGDALKWVGISRGNDEVILTTKAGQAIHFKEKDVRPMGRPASGVRGIRAAGSNGKRLWQKDRPQVL